MKDDPSQVVHQDSGAGYYEYRGECSKCYYTGPWLKSEESASGLLELHRKSRDHKTNVQSQYRFTV